ncbi:MAG: hypothetical protein JNM33_15105 [Rubrivivax sp.]|nr:hypothetical protein [Rubrivivax sp.]
MIADFLQRLRPAGPWVLTAIVPDGKTDTQTFTDAGAAEAWALAANKTANLYYSVNPTIGPVTKKATKEQIAALSFLHVDLDPRAGEDFAQERARILALLTTNRPEGIPAPTVCVDSGGGYQALWRLAEPIPLNGDVAKAEDAERWNRALERVFGADHCHDCSRVLRLPGTKNLPNKKKRAAGRAVTDAEVYDWPEGADAYPLSAFAVKLPPPKGASGTATASRKASKGAALAVGASVGVDELRAWAAANGRTIPDAALAMVATGADPIDPDRHAGDRSRAVYAVACSLVRAGLPDALIVAALTNPSNLISAHVLDQKGNKITYAQRQVDRARADEAAQAEAPSWDRVDKEGNPARSFPNTVTALRLMGVACSFDVFKGRNIVGLHELQEFAGEFSDQAESVLRREVRLRYGFDPGKDHVKDAVLELCALNRFDPLADHLNALPPWDGVPRLDTWLPDLLGAEDAPYTREAGATWLLAAVVRAFEPGTKFDHMLVLVGAQGVGKSTALRILASDEFFSDANFLGAKDTREVLEATTGAWIVECAELAGMRRKDTETLKYEITKQEDKGRHAYARNPVSVPRRFVLAGTTNSGRFLHDETGNRRFWPVEVSRVDLEGLKAARAQLLAEALARYRARGFRLYLTGDAAAGAERAQQDRRAVEEGYVEQLERLPWSHTLKGAPAVTTDEVYNLLVIPRERRQGQTAVNVSRAMEALGWTKTGHPVRLDDDPTNKQRAYVWTGEGRPSGRRLDRPTEAEREDAGLPF